MAQTRRNFILHSLLTTAGIFASLPLAASDGFSKEDLLINPFTDDMAFKLSIFSKHLHWLDYEGMADAAAELGFDGVDLTVRPDGHVLPERVTEDLPKAFEAVKKAGLNMYSIVTAISDADDPRTEEILKTASRLGIRLYRLNWYHYDDKLSIEENLKQISGKLKKLDALNKKYKIQGLNQNHSGQYFSAPIWDLAQTLKGIHALSTGSQYDIYHATIEGMNSWIYGFRLIRPYIKMINFKDFQWTKKEGKWKTESVPLGEGAVDWKTYFTMLKTNHVKVPVSIHYEYFLGGAEEGGKSISIPKEQVFSAMKKDIEFVKRSLQEAGLTS